MFTIEYDNLDNNCIYRFMYNKLVFTNNISMLQRKQRTPFIWCIKTEKKALPN